MLHYINERCETVHKKITKHTLKGKETIMFGTKVEPQVKVGTAADSIEVPEVGTTEAKGTTQVAASAVDSKKEARKASAKRMQENKKKAITVLVEYAKRMNTGDNAEKEVTDAVNYLTGANRHSAAVKTSVINEMFPTVGTVLKSVDIFIKWEKGRSEMITLIKRAATKDFIVEYDEAKKQYTRTK